MLIWKNDNTSFARQTQMVDFPIDLCSKIVTYGY